MTGRIKAGIYDLVHVWITPLVSQQLHQRQHSTRLFMSAQSTQDGVELMSDREETMYRHTADCCGLITVLAECRTQFCVITNPLLWNRKLPVHRTSIRAYKAYTNNTQHIHVPGMWYQVPYGTYSAHIHIYLRATCILFCSGFPLRRASKHNTRRQTHDGCLRNST